MQREENKAQRFLRRCMCAVCALMFAFFILVFLLSAQGPAWCRLAWTAAFVCLLASAAWLCRHFASFVAKYFSLLAGGAALAFFAAAVVFAVMLRFDPIYDLEAYLPRRRGLGRLWRIDALYLCLLYTSSKPYMKTAMSQFSK